MNLGEFSPLLVNRVTHLRTVVRILWDFRLNPSGDWILRVLTSSERRIYISSPSPVGTYRIKS